MFGFSLAAQLFQGSAQRTWNCVTQFSNLLWYKFNHFKYPIMPRSRRRHHSRSRSRSHSHDRDREAKRRKIDNVDSPSHKRSVSAEPKSTTPKSVSPIKDTQNDQGKEIKEIIPKPETKETQSESSKIQSESNEPSALIEDGEAAEPDKTTETENDTKEKMGEKPIKQIEEKLTITPKKTLSPKQLQKRLESEKKREEKRLEREERERKKQEEKNKKQEEKDKLKEQKSKERELKEEEKNKKREEKEARRKEKEEREEMKRKERELEKLKKQQELEEKNREKQKMVEQKQKAAQAFVNFFVAKEGKTEAKCEEKKMFMPFEVKSDMRLAPLRRVLSDEEKENLIDVMNKGDATYLVEIKGRSPRRCGKTWPYDADDDVMIVEDFGESICEDKQKRKKMRVKFLKFHENRRPAYYGTWRKKSGTIKPRRPFIADKGFFDYDVDSDDDWEEEEQGESLNGSDDEEKENEVENDDYEVDNEFFVPHGHLSDDEVDDEELSKLSPESHKLKLKLLKDEFDEDMQAKINKVKARSIGCIWYNKDGGNVDHAIDRHLRPLAMITNGQVIINRRKDFVAITSLRRNTKELQQEFIPAFLKIIQGNVNKKAKVVDEFLNYMKTNGHVVEVSKAYLKRCLKQYAQWKKCGEEGPLFNKYCWCLEDDFKKKCGEEGPLFNKYCWCLEDDFKKKYIVD